MGGGKPAVAFLIAQAFNIIWTLIFAYLIFGGILFPVPAVLNFKRLKRAWRLMATRPFLTSSGLTIPSSFPTKDYTPIILWQDLTELGRFRKGICVEVDGVGAIQERKIEIPETSFLSG